MFETNSGEKNMKKQIPDRERHPATRFDPETRTRLGQQLRVMYGEVMDQGVPERFHQLLQRLDTAP
jgi:hypothetical protein